ncbi:hypothetical protein KSP40_PGU018103 [Platanthera guangdongensis]|uniref:Uncharacterized protein n=1 Tax=Platanthera guangdongensis TaxID=2320717 RepID=A0ABR2LKR5_9ASPA
MLFFRIEPVRILQISDQRMQELKSKCFPSKHCGAVLGASTGKGNENVRSLDQLPLCGKREAFTWARNLILDAVGLFRVLLKEHEAFSIDYSSTALHRSCIGVGDVETENCSRNFHRRRCFLDLALGNFSAVFLEFHADIRSCLGQRRLRQVRAWELGVQVETNSMSLLRQGRFSGSHLLWRRSYALLDWVTAIDALGSGFLWRRADFQIQPAPLLIAAADARPFSAVGRLIQPTMILAAVPPASFPAAEAEARTSLPPAPPTSSHLPPSDRRGGIGEERQKRDHERGPDRQTP